MQHCDTGPPHADQVVGSRISDLRHPHLFDPAPPGLQPKLYLDVDAEPGRAPYLFNVEPGNSKAVIGPIMSSSKRCRSV